jgi:hypothetical protein
MVYGSSTIYCTRNRTANVAFAYVIDSKAGKASQVVMTGCCGLFGAQYALVYVRGRSRSASCVYSAFMLSSVIFFLIPTDMMKFTLGTGYAVSFRVRRSSSFLSLH